MARAGLIAQRGSKRGTYYEAADPLLEIRQRVVELGPPVDTGSLFDI